MTIAAAEILFSIGTWAAELGTSRDVLRRVLAHAGVVAAGTRSGHPIYRGRDVCQAWATHLGASADNDPDKLPPIERKAHWQAEREKLHLGLERGDVVASLDVEQRYASRNKLIDQAIETAPDVLERDVGLSSTQAARLEKHLDELRVVLHRLLVEEDADSAVQVGG